ncbi:MAG: hypothetical protein ACKVQS_14305 [Fimbriimonadaceae bacterium]
MAETKEFKEESTDRKAPSGLVLIAAGVALGLGATAWLMKRKHDTKIAWDPDSILDACDNAAAKLDEILFAETRQVG